MKSREENQRNTKPETRKMGEVLGNIPIFNSPVWEGHHFITLESIKLKHFTAAVSSTCHIHKAEYIGIRIQALMYLIQKLLRRKQC